MSEGTPGWGRRPGALARTPIKELQRRRQAQEQGQQQESLFMTQPSQDEREAAQRAAAAQGSPMLRTSPRNAARAAAASGGPQSTPVATSAVKGAGSALAGTPRRSPVKQTPRTAAAERPPGPEVDLGIANPFVKRGLRRSPPLGAPAETAAPAPDLDPQPTDQAAAINTRAQERLQRLRGAQTRSPGIGVGDFDFALPPLAPRPVLMTVPVAPSPLVQAQSSAAPPESTNPAGPPPRRSIGLPGQSNPTHPAANVAAPAVPTTAAADPSPAVAQTQSFIMQQGGDSSAPARVATPTPAAPPTRRTEQWLPPRQPEERAPKSPGHLPRARREEQEPELPPTPTQRGIADPVVTTPPTGIHNTPNKRRTVHRSSPLKPRESPPAQSQPQQQSRPSSREREPSEPPEESEPQPKRHKAGAPTSRFLTSTDSNAAKKRKRDRVFAEIAQLEADIKLAEKENTRLQKYANNPSLAPKRPANVDAVVEMLARTMAPPPTFEEPPKFRENVFDKISSFLPFSRRPKPKKTEMPKPETLPSVLPLEVEDPLPFLSVFTSFKFTSTVTSLPPTPGPGGGAGETADILQLHSISTIAPLEPCLSKINVTVNTTNGSVMRLEVEHMDSAATLELGAWVRERGKQGVLGRDVNAVFWAQGGWYENAVRRARFWCLVEGEMGTREGREKVRARLRARAKRARGGQVEVEGEEERSWTKWELRRHFKEQQVGIDIEGVKVVICWKIEFDWTGEAESLVTCEVKPNKTFLEVDERESLKKVADIFNGMVKEQSPIEAARAVVVQLMGDI